MPAVLAFGYCVTAIFAWPSSVALHAKILIVFAFAWLRTSYIACWARHSGYKLADTRLTELYIGSLKLIVLVALVVAATAAVPIAIIREITRGVPAADNLSWLLELIVFAMLLDVWKPVLQPRAYIRPGVPLGVSVEENSLPTQPGIRFELGTLLLIITLVCINLGLATVSALAVFFVDFLLLVVGMFSWQYRLDCTRRGRLRLAEQLDLFCTVFLWIVLGVLLAITATLIATALLPVPSPCHSVLFGEMKVPCTTSIAVGCGLVFAAVVRFFALQHIRKRVSLLIEASKQARELEPPPFD